MKYHAGVTAEIRGIWGNTAYRSRRQIGELVRAALCRRCLTSVGHYFAYFFFYFGPSGVRALPLAAGTNEGGHYFRYIFPLLVIFLLPPLFKTTEGVVVGFQIVAWASKKNNKNLCTNKN